MKMLPKNPSPFNLKGCFLAGGAILSAVRREEPADYDYYFKNRKAFVDAIFELSDDSCFLVNVSDRAITFKSNHVKNEKGERAVVQLCMGNYYDTAEDIYKSFDFSPAMAAFDCDSQEYIFHEDFWPSVSQKRLLFNPGTNWPIASLLRAKKYTDKGFSISRREYLKMSMAILNRGMPQGWEDLALQIGGFYGKQITIDNQGLDFNYENVLKIVEDIDFEGYAIEDNSAVTFDVEDFAELLEKDTIIYVPIHITDYKLSTNEPFKKSALIIYQNNNEWFLDRYVDMNIIEMIKAVSSDISIIEVDNVNLSVVKYLRTEKDGTLTSGIHTSKKATYSLGGITECHESPYLFSWPNKKRSPGYMYNSMDSHYYKALVNTSDIRYVQGNEIQSTKIKIVTKLESTDE